MTDHDVDRDVLQEELGQIKRAMGLSEAHPYWVRSWLVEGIAVAVLFPLFQLGLRDGFDARVTGLIVVTYAGFWFAGRRIRARAERPTTGVPSWTTWHAVVFAGMGALIVGLDPVFDLLDEARAFTLAMVVGGTVVGVGYMFMGQLLAAYEVRRSDRYAFYVGGAWILVLAACIPHVGAFDGWEFAVLGVGIGFHGVVTFLVLSRI